MDIYKFCGKNLEVEKRKPGKFNKVVLIKANNKEEAEKFLKNSLEHPSDEFPTFLLTEKKEDKEAGIIDQYYVSNVAQ